MSRIGKKAITIPKGVTVKVLDGAVEVQGPKGKLKQAVPDRIRFEVADGELHAKLATDDPELGKFHGLARSLVANAVAGVTDGFKKELDIVGVGYRAEVKGKQLVIQVGFSHPTAIELPATISAVVPPDSKGTMIVLTSADKELLGRFAATVRDLRPPEPYGGKGIRYRGEVVKRKAGKAAKGKGK